MFKSRLLLICLVAGGTLSQRPLQIALQELNSCENALSRGENAHHLPRSLFESFVALDLSEHFVSIAQEGNRAKTFRIRYCKLRRFARCPVEAEVMGRCRGDKLIP